MDIFETITIIIYLIFIAMLLFLAYQKITLYWENRKLKALLLQKAALIEESQRLKSESTHKPTLNSDNSQLKAIHQQKMTILEESQRLKAENAQLKKILQENSESF
ncbi:MAG: hypothetical protein FWG68_03530 [Defluviitaleaceae bacterium]|nr:hypothetical protein [Defluviitaleaceae bacterium]